MLYSAIIQSSNYPDYPEQLNLPGFDYPKQLNLLGFDYPKQLTLLGFNGPKLIVANSL